MAWWRCSASATAEDFELRDIRILEFVSRKTVAILSSQHDSLTGLVNRLIFERRMQSLLDAGPGTHALLYFDIDHLESINEAFGFQAGDEVIQRVADMIRRAAGAAAIVCRIGGDRFAALLPQSDINVAHEVGKRVLAATAQLGYVHGVDAVPIGVSIGALEIARRQDPISHLMAAAELACKRAKQQGGGRLAVADESSTSVHSRGAADTSRHRRCRTRSARTTSASRPNRSSVSACDPGRPSGTSCWFECATPTAR